VGGQGPLQDSKYYAVKGTVSRDGFDLNILVSTFCVWFSRSFKRFSLPYTIINILVASLKLLTNSYRNPPQNFLLCDRLMFSGADLLLAAGKMRKN
jgi:hypothetical protein